MMKEKPIVVDETVVNEPIMVDETVVKEPIVVGETVVNETIVVTKSKPTKPGFHKSVRPASYRASHTVTRHRLLRSPPYCDEARLLQSLPYHDRTRLVP